MPKVCARAILVFWLDHNGRTVAENLSDSPCYFSRVETRANDCVSAELRGVFEHKVERVLASLFAELRKERDVSPDKRLQARPNAAYDRTAAYDNAARNAQVFYNRVARELKRRGDHTVVD